jgi:formimidoylglutamate deiminase
MKSELRFEHILLPRGLERHRRVVVDAAGFITAVEPCAPEGPFDGWLALPGMPNAHSHAFQRALAGRGERAAGEDSFWSWREAMYALAGAVTAEELHVIARRAYADMLAAGYTSVAEFHYLHHGPDGSRGAECAAAVMEAAASAGIRLALFPVFYARGGFGRSASPRQARFIHRTLEEFAVFVAALPEAPAGLAAHSLRAVPPECLADLAALADEAAGPGAPIHIHIAEQPAEVEECLAATGMRPIECLARHVALGPRWMLVHATHADAAERALVAEAGATVVLCPLTEAYLGDGLFPAAEFVGEGGRIAVGSDSNVRIDAVEELRWLEYGQRLATGRRACLADEGGLGDPLWRRAAAGGAAAVGAPVGHLAPGFFADLVSVDPGAAVFEGLEGPAEVLDAMVTSGDARCLAGAWVGGRPAVPAQAAGYGAVVRSLAARTGARL